MPQVKLLRQRFCYSGKRGPGNETLKKRKEPTAFYNRFQPSAGPGKNLKLTSGTSAEYCKEELNSGSRSLTSVSRISSKTLLLWRPSETCTCKGCRDTVNAETKLRVDGKNERPKIYTVLSLLQLAPRTGKQRLKFSLFKQKCTSLTTSL